MTGWDQWLKCGRPSSALSRCCCSRSMFPLTVGTRRGHSKTKKDPGFIPMERGQHRDIGTGRIRPLADSKQATNATTPPSRIMLGGAVQDRTLQSPGTYLSAQAVPRFKGTGNTEFIGVGGTLTHIGVCAGPPRHSSPRGRSQLPPAGAVSLSYRCWPPCHCRPRKGPLA
jgi:hypothetical protein